MRLRVVSKLSQRSISNLEILFKFVFGGKPPELFEENKYYVKNSIIFTIEDNVPRLIQCMESGRFSQTDLKDKTKWKDITVIDFISSGATEEMFNQLKQVIGELEDYKGGKYDTVVDITNNLHTRLKSLILNFPDYNSKVDGGNFTDEDPLPPVDSDEFKEKIEYHNETKNSHANILIDGSDDGSDDIIVDDPLIDDELEDILNEHNQDEDCHNSMIIDGSFDEILEPTVRRVRLYSYGDLSGIVDRSDDDNTSQIIIKHNSNPKSHSKLTIDGNKD